MGVLEFVITSLDSRKNCAKHKQPQLLEFFSTWVHLMVVFKAPYFEQSVSKANSILLLQAIVCGCDHFIWFDVPIDPICKNYSLFLLRYLNCRHLDFQLVY